jgi:hypothetical protein
MRFSNRLEINDLNYEPTKQTLIKNGSKVSEHIVGSRKTLYSNNIISGYSKTENNLPISDDLPISKFYSFLSSFKRSLYNQIRKNDEILNLKIEFNGISRDKNHDFWKKVKFKEIFYNIDLSSAYWQIAYKLGYISKKIFLAYIDKDEYKEAKRYCVSFLARENEMRYYDDREINVISCDISCLNQIYINIRHELYNLIEELKNLTNNNWIEYNIDGISVKEKHVEIITKKLNEINLKYKINQCIKIDKEEYFIKTKIRKF